MILNYPYGVPSLSGVIKSCPEDFHVVEELGFEPEGQGEHLFLLVEKTGLSTQQLIERVAVDFQVPVGQIGYSGLKDKQAVTRQWLSLPIPIHSLVSDSHEGDGYRVIEQNRHRKKLRPGTHKSNYFRVCIREVDDFPESGRQQLKRIAEQGYANYFGEQRFGRKQDNVEQALLRLAETRLPRWRKGLLLSSLRSHLFNQILTQRIDMDYWQQPLDGDVFMLRGSHSIFTEKLDQVLQQRYQSMDIASTASLYGSGCCLLSEKPLEIEAGIFAANPQMTECLDRHNAKRQMRALRVPVEDFNYVYDPAAHTLVLKLRLPAGSYLTSLLDHFLHR